MKKIEAEEEDDLRPEYDFSEMMGAVRGKYAERFRKGTNLVLLDPDVAAAFPDAKAVNDALRQLLQQKERLRHTVDAFPCSNSRAAAADGSQGQVPTCRDAAPGLRSYDCSP